MYEDRMALFEKKPGAFAVYLAFEKTVLQRFPNTQLSIKKTQIGFFDGCGFAWAWPIHGRIRNAPETCIGITLGLPERLISPRITDACEPYPGRWTHHMLVSSTDDLDAELIEWLDIAHAFALSRKRKNRKEA